MYLKVFSNKKPSNIIEIINYKEAKDEK